ncbi:Uncharacterised protein [Mycobacteroides abscessus subsp. abscessus]|nr:Uncharacterised protein [Mycobacteroides abscessus subsp. abscessus]
MAADSSSPSVMNSGTTATRTPIDAQPCVKFDAMIAR